MNVTVVGIGSGIGYELAYRYIAQGERVQGTYNRNRPDSYLIAEGSPFPNSASVGFVECDMTNQNHLVNAAENLESWDLLIFCPGIMEPVGSFWAVDTFKWDHAIRVNALGPLRLFRYLYSKRNPGASVCFFAGPNLKNRTPGYSAYRAGKVLLTDMVSEIDWETPDLKVFMLAPGVVDTPIHKQSGDPRGVYKGKVQTTPHDDIFACLKWCLEQPKEKVGGRCVHVVNDPWRGGYLRT